ncbi:GntR family transcriptional regulator [Microbacterium sp. 22303]|uniref:GntR family transcriptional regulator n=1 Tax=Microbacterium sp. 22303 TaxID=3453905 RepID=UPI003F833CF0
MLQREAAPLRSQLVARLREDIIEGQYAAGDRLIEKNLEATYGVSRTVVREALRQLESEQLVEIVPNIGPKVRGLTYDDVVHLYQVRAALESAACRLAAESSSVDAARGVRQAYEHLREHAAAVSVADLIVEKNKFYDALIQASGNPIIGEMLTNVQARIAQLRFITLGTPDRTPHMLDEIRKIVEAIEDSDPDTAAMASIAHVESAAEIAKQHVAHLRLTPSAES